MKRGVQARAVGDAFELDLYGDVGWEITPRGVSNALKEADGSPVMVALDSYGGDAVAGITIYNLLTRYEGAVAINVDGIAASAASLIAMAGTTREQASNAFLMIHNAWGYAMGEAKDMQKQAEVLAAISASYRDAYAQVTGIDGAVIEAMMDAETWLTGEEAAAQGFMTGTTGASSNAMAMAMPEGRFLRVPQGLMDRLPRASAPVVAPAAAPAPTPPAAADPEPEPVAPVEPAAPADPVFPPPLDPEPAAAAPAQPIEPEPAPQPAAASGNPTGLGSLTPTQSNLTMTDSAARESEITRQDTIRGMCEKAVASGRIGADKGKELANKFSKDGSAVEDVRAALFELVVGAPAGIAGQGIAAHGAGQIGMSAQEVERWNLCNVARYLDNPTSREAREAVGLELEASAAAGKVPGQKPTDGGILMPQDVLVGRFRGGMGSRPRAASQQTVGDFGGGGALVPNQHLDSSFIEAVYERSAILRSGMTMLTGLTGTATIGKQTSGSSTYWVGEDQDVTESGLGFGLTTLSAKTIGSRLSFSRLSLKQTSPDVEMLAWNDAVKKMALGIDRAFLYANGSEFQPLGLANIAGLASVTLANGQDMTYTTKQGGGSHNTGDWLNYVTMESLIGSEELDVPSMRYLMNTMTRGGCKTTLRASAAGSDYVMADNGQINGYEAIVSNIIQQNDVFFGDWSSALGGMWGAVDMIRDPYTQSANGQVIITMFQDVDFAVRYLESFVKAS